MANAKKIFRTVKHLASDLKHCGYNQDQLEQVCKAEAVRLDMPAEELSRKVQAAYISQYVYGEQ